MRRLLQQAGELGLLGAGVPELYGGYDLPKSAIALLTEKAAINPSLAISAGVHSGVSQLPLLYFGTEAQKQRYLPKLDTGEWIGAAALSEAACAARRAAAAATDTRVEEMLYARVDGVVRSDRLLLMELELIEPVLFFAHAPSAAVRMAELNVSK